MVEPFLIRRPAIGSTPIVEGRRVERPHRSELGAISGRWQLSYRCLSACALSLGDLGGNGKERGGKSERAQQRSAREHFVFLRL